MSDNAIESLPGQRGPGLVLRQARERLGWSVEEVALALRLSPTYIEKIERDDHTGASLLIYERGYLRSYARHLGLSENLIADLVERFNRLGLTEHAPSAITGTNLSWDVWSSGRLIRRRRWLFYLGALTAALSVLVWWQTQAASPSDLHDEVYGRLAKVELSEAKTSSMDFRDIPAPMASAVSVAGSAESEALALEEDAELGDEAE